MTPRIGEWVKEFGLDVIGMMPLRDTLRASRMTSVH
jgi:hypothetical protein